LDPCAAVRFRWRLIWVTYAELKVYRPHFCARYESG